MLLRVQIQPAALVDAEEYAVFIRDEKQDPIAALRWYDGLVEAILSLESMPGRYPVIPEQDSFRISLRHLHYHSHRVIFQLGRTSRNQKILGLFSKCFIPLPEPLLLLR